MWGGPAGRVLAEGMPVGRGISGGDGDGRRG